MFKIPSFTYFVPFIIVVLIAVFLIIFTRNKNEEFNRRLIFILLIVNVSLHFIKIFFPMRLYWNGLPSTISKITAENICAVNIMIYPILFCFKNKYFNDVICFVGFVSGVAAFLVPSGVVNVAVVDAEAIIECIRYYFCHAILILVPIIMIANKMVIPSYRRVYPLALSFFCILTIVFINDLLLKVTGIMNITWEQFFSRNCCNPSMIYGPSNAMYYGGFNKLMWSVLPFTRYTTATYDMGFIPLVWFISPLFIIATLITLIAMIFDHKNVKKDFIVIKEKIKNRKLKKVESKDK